MSFTDHAGPQDFERRRALGRMRLTAGGLLILMLAVFLVTWRTEAGHPWLSYLRAFAEAAMVGGLADWFAVAALFRHPLGLPIPHTAIVPRNKDRIADSLGSFVANNFLSPDVILDKVRNVDIAGRLAGWLGRPGNAPLLARRVAAALPPFVMAMRDEPARQLLQEAAAERLRGIAAAPLLSRLLTILLAGGRHLALFDLGLATARRFVIDNHDEIIAKIKDKSLWWTPKWVDERLARLIVEGGLETLDEMCQPDHPWRLKFVSGLTELVDRLAHSADTKSQIDAVKEEIIRHPEVQAYLASLWHEAKRVILSDLAAGDRVERALGGTLAGLAARLEDDAALRNLVNSWASRIVLYVVVPNRQSLGAFMAGVVRSWDAPTLVGKLELQFGRDLQYIRINGTLVGGVVGLAIHALSQTTQ